VINIAGSGEDESKIKKYLKENSINSVNLLGNQTQTQMTTQTQQPLELLQKNVISKENAVKNSNRPEELIKMIENL
jgi:twitching motility protein PilT